MYEQYNYDHRLLSNTDVVQSSSNDTSEPKAALMNPKQDNDLSDTFD